MSYQSEVQNWISVRLAVGSALLIGSALFYIAYWYTMFSKDKKAYIYMSEVASKYYLFGLGALLCLNYAQAGIFQTVLVFITMFSFLVLVFSAIMSESIDDKKRSILYVVYYFFLFIWYLGIVIDFYVTYK
jgi:cbb3-type cytochrome oxidase subunit 3